MKSVQWFLTRRVLKFSIQINKENKPGPLAAIFFTNHDGLNNLDRGLHKKHSCNVEIGPVVSEKKIIKIFYKDILGK